MWVWDQSAGTLCHNGQIVSRGYSGLDYGKNNPLKENVPGIGPIPRGHWEMTGIYHSLKTGPFTIQLRPELGTDTCGRSEFRIHGDSLSDPGRASHGCIILPRPIRQLMWDSKDHILSVVE